MLTFHGPFEDFFFQARDLVRAAVADVVEPLDKVVAHLAQEAAVLSHGFRYHHLFVDGRPVFVPLFTLSANMERLKNEWVYFWITGWMDEWMNHIVLYMFMGEEFLFYDSTQLMQGQTKINLRQWAIRVGFSFFCSSLGYASIIDMTVNRNGLKQTLIMIS